MTDGSSADEWAWVLTSDSLVEFVGRKRRTLERWERQSIVQPLPLPGGARGATTYWSIHETVVAKCISQMHRYGFDDVTVLSKRVRAVLPVDGAAVPESFTIYWVGDDLIRTTADLTETSLVTGAETVSTLGRLELPSTFVPVNIADLFERARELAVERNLDAIRRDPLLRRSNYSGWKQQGVIDRPDRRPEQPPLFD